MSVFLQRLGLLDFVAAGGEGTPWPNPAFANVEFLMAMDSDTSPQDEESDNAYAMAVAGSINTDATRQLFSKDSLLFPNSTFADIDGTETNDLFNLETGDFVIEGWVYNIDTGAAGNMVNVYRSQSGAFYRQWVMQLSATNTLRMYMYKESTDDNYVDLHHQTTIPTNEFSHVAMCRKGDDHFCFVNGVPSTTVVTSTKRPTGEGTEPLRFGNNANDNSRFRGNLAEWRITQGECPLDKDTTYAVPTGPFPRVPDAYNPAFTSVEFLEDFIDQTSPEISDNAYTEVWSGLTSDTVNKLFGNNTTAFPSGAWKQMYDNNAPADTFGLITGDFVIEGWVYNSQTTEGTLVGLYRSQSGARYRSWLMMIDDSSGTRSGTAYSLEMYLYNESTDTNYAVVVGPAVPRDTWTHVAVMRIGDDHYCFTDGVPGTKVTSTNRPTGEGSEPLRFGNTANDAIRFIGSLGEWRVTLGEAFYPITGFTPPTAPFPRS